MINNREDANKYYQLINELVDDYINKWKIRPSNLRRYLKPGSERFNRFLERNKLKDIKGAERVLRDVIEDRHHMESDGVIKFESFKLFESDEFKINSLTQCLYKGIEKSDIKMEKILADFFDTSLGQIDVIDSGKHIFKLNDWKSDEVFVIIYSEEELDIIKNNMIDYLFTELTKKKVTITNKISVNLSDLIKFNMFEEQLNQLFTEQFLIDIITDCLSDYKYHTNYSGHSIWIKE